jgi:hypothetical protein
MLICFSIFSAWRSHQIMLQTTSLYREMAGDVFYPEHPFSAELCTKLTRFPPGFRELALSRKLSVDCVDYIHLIVVACTDGLEHNEALSIPPDGILGRSGLTTLERLLATALSTYGFYVERRTRSPSTSFVMYVQQQVRLLAFSAEIFTCDPDVLAWSCLMLRATADPSSDLWRWADARLRTMGVSASRQVELGEAFLPIPRPNVALP